MIYMPIIYLEDNWSGLKLHIWHQIQLKRAEKGSVPIYDVQKYRGYSENWLVSPL